MSFEEEGAGGGKEVRGGGEREKEVKKERTHQVISGFQVDDQSKKMRGRWR